MSDGRAVVVLDPAELRALIQEAVRDVLEAKTSEPSEWLDTAAAAKLLGIKTRTVTKLAKEGAIPSSRLGKLYRFRRDALLAHLEATERRGP